MIPEDCPDFLDDCLEFLEKPKTSISTIANGIFCTFEDSVNSSFILNLERKKQIFLPLVVNGIIGLQAISLCWFQEIKISNWKDYELLFRILGYSSFDNICEELSIFDICSICSVAVLFYIFVSISLLSFVKILWSYSPMIIVFITGKLILIATTVAFMPLLTILLKILNYSSSQVEKLKTDQNEPSNSIWINFGIAGECLSIILIIGLVLLAIFSEFFMAELRHSKMQKNILARSNSYFDIYLKLVYSLFCILNWVFSKGFEEYFYISQMLFSTLMYFILISRLPYYNTLQNIIYEGVLASIWSTSLSFLLATYIDEAEIAILSIFILQPAVIFLASYKLNQRANYISNESNSPKTSQIHFELRLRKWLTREKLDFDYEPIIKKFSKYNLMFKTDLLVIWEVNFCMDVIKDINLAKIKLLQLNNTYRTLEGLIQEHRICKKISQINFFNETQISYLIEMRNLKRKDKELCHILMEIFNQIISDSCEANKLTNLVVKLSDSFNSVSDLYSSMAEKYNDPEIYECLSSFVDSILGSSDIAARIREKNSSLRRRKEINIIENSKGRLIILGNSERLGTVIFMNKKMANILEIPEKNYKSWNFLSILPNSWAYPWKLFMQNYLKCSSKSSIPAFNKFYIKNINGNLVECKMNGSLAVVDGNAFFLIDLEPQSCKREIILLDSNYTVLEYSSQIPLIFTGPNDTIHEGSHIYEYIPNFSLFKKEKTNHIDFNNQEMLGYLYKPDYLSLSNYILEIYNDKSETEYNTLKDLNPCLSTQDYLFENKFKHHQEEEDKIETNFKSYENEDKWISQEEINECLSLSANSRSKSFKEVSQRFVGNSKNAVKVLQWVLLISIVFMIFINCLVLWIIYKNVSHEVSLQTFSHLGQILYHLSSFSEIVRDIDAALGQGRYNLTWDLELLVKGVEDLNKLKGTILSDYDQWSYCQSSQIVKKKVIPLWTFEPEPLLSKHTLYDIIQEIINHAQSLILIAKVKGDYIPDFEFLVINCLTFTYDYVSRALESLVNCEIDRIHETSLSIYGFMWVGFFSIGFCTLILIFFIIRIEIRYNEAWRYIRKKTLSSYQDLNGCIAKRLEEVHKTFSCDNLNKKTLSKKKISIKSKITRKYILKIGFFLVVALSFYFLLIFLLYPKTEKKMKYRPLLLNHFVYKKSTLSRLGYFTRDKNDPRFLLHYPTSDALHNPNISYVNTVSLLKSKLKDIRGTNYLNLMSEDLKSSIFRLQSSPINNFMIYGSLYATNYLLLEADYIGNPTSAANIVVRYNFIKNYTALQDIIEDEYNMANSDSKNYIYNELNIFAFVTLAYSLFLLSLYFSYYLPYLHNEIKMIDKLNNLMAVIK